MPEQPRAWGHELATPQVTTKYLKDEERVASPPSVQVFSWSPLGMRRFQKRTKLVALLIKQEDRLWSPQSDHFPPPKKNNQSLDATHRCRRLDTHVQSSLQGHHMQLKGRPHTSCVQLLHCMLTVNYFAPDSAVIRP